jgi:hypothetical protein
MYIVSEKTMDRMLCEATSLLDRLQHTSLVDKMILQGFGTAVVDVQTELHRQRKTQHNGLFEERLR